MKVKTFFGKAFQNHILKAVGGQHMLYVKSDILATKISKSKVLYYYGKIVVYCQIFGYEIFRSFTISLQIFSL